jgi:hypothetical protein
VSTSTIYLVITDPDFYGAYEPIVAFTHKADAERLIADGVGSEILEVTLSAMALAVGTWYTTCWYATVDHHDNPFVREERVIRSWDDEDTAAEIRDNRTEFKWGAERKIAGVELGAWDRDQLMRMYHEARKDALARQEAYDAEWNNRRGLNRKNPPKQESVTFLIATEDK